MKYDIEADILDLIEGVRTAYSDSQDKHEGDRRYDGWDFAKEVKEIVEILENQVPKKPYYLTGEMEWHCPNCDSMSIFNYENVPLNYCNECGQKLDWSNE